MTALALALEVAGCLGLAAMGTAKVALLLHIALAGWIGALDTGRHGQAPMEEGSSLGFGFAA